MNSTSRGVRQVCSGCRAAPSTSVCARTRRRARPRSRTGVVVRCSELGAWANLAESSRKSEQGGPVDQLPEQPVEVDVLHEVVSGGFHCEESFRANELVSPKGLRVFTDATMLHADGVGFVTCLAELTFRISSTPNRHCTVFTASFAQN